MRSKKLTSMLLFGFVTVSLLSTSIGGAFASSALAAEAAEGTTAVEQKQDTKNKDVLGGILAVGLIAALANHGGHGDKSSAASSSTGVTGTSGQSSKTTTTNTSTKGSSSEVQQALSLLNADRAKNGLPALALNSALSNLGDAYAQDMINRNFFSHYNPEGQSPFDRMKSAGIGYTYAGENLAINTSVAAAETAFMNSSGHRANILNQNYTQVGLGVRHDAKGSVYVVQEFIRP